MHFYISTSAPNFITETPDFEVKSALAISGTSQDCIFINTVYL